MSTALLVGLGGVNPTAHRSSIAEDPAGMRLILRKEPPHPEPGSQRPSSSTSSLRWPTARSSGRPGR